MHFIHETPVIPFFTQCLPALLLSNVRSMHNSNIQQSIGIIKIFLNFSHFPFTLCCICRFRVFCHWLVNHSTFGNIILLCIMCSSALLAVEKPLEKNPEQVIFFTFFQFESIPASNHLNDYFSFLTTDTQIS